MTERILVVHVAAIGDAAIASTVVERLRAEAPGADVTWVCGQVARPIVELFEGVSRVIAVDQTRLFHGGPVRRAGEIFRLWGALARRSFDRVFVLHPDPRYRVLVLPLMGAEKFFLSRAEHGRMNPVPGRFLGDEYARLIGGPEHVGPLPRIYPMADLRSKFTRARTGNAKRVLIVPGGAKNVLRENALRRWPLEHYVALARALNADGCEVVLVGSAHDQWVRPAFAGIPVEDRLGEWTLTQTLEGMNACDLVISHDTGPMHLARLVRAPLVALFGPTMPAQFLSVDDSVTVIWGGADLACRPCYDGREFANCANNICLGNVVPDMVLAAARARLQAT